MNKLIERPEDATILDAVSRGSYCPGFYLYKVLGTDGLVYLVSADYPGGVQTRVFFHTRGLVSVVSPIEENCELVGDNPDAKEWELLNP